MINFRQLSLTIRETPAEKLLEIRSKWHKVLEFAYFFAGK